MEVAEEGLVDGGLGEGFLILEFGREVDAVVLTDIADGLRGELLGFGRYAHSIEDVSTGL